MGNLPSASLAWVATQEPFLSDLGFYLKLRTSYGRTETRVSAVIQAFQEWAQGNYAYGSSSAIGIYPSTLANADLGWETTASYNVGADFGLLENRITGSVDAYIAQTTDVLVQRQLPRSSGYTSVWTNIGSIDNKGMRLRLNH